MLVLERKLILMILKIIDIISKQYFIKTSLEKKIKKKIISDLKTIIKINMRWIIIYDYIKLVIKCHLLFFLCIVIV